MIFPFKVKHNKMMAFNHRWAWLAVNYPENISMLSDI